VEVEVVVVLVFGWLLFALSVSWDFEPT
jgi:hypothetical protein